MSRDDLLKTLREQMQGESMSCLILPEWAQDILHTDNVDGIPVYYSDNVQPESAGVH